MRLEEARRHIVSVRPTKDGKWEVAECTAAEDADWQRQWADWWATEGLRLQAEHPDWWDEGCQPLEAQPSLKH